MRILYIHQYFCTRQGRSGTRSYEFAKYLVRQGHRVTMLTSSSEVFDLEIPEGKAVHRCQVDGIDVLVVRVRYAQNMRPWRRVWAFLQFMLISTWVGCRSRGHDVVYATSTPLTVGFPGVLASWSQRVPFVFEIRDLWPEAPIQLGVIRNRLFIWMLRRFERFLYSRSKHVVALSPGMRRGVLAAGVPESKVSVIPNCSDLDLFQPGPPAPGFLSRHGLASRFVAIHAGSMGMANGLDVLVDAASILQGAGHDDVRIVIVGQGGTAKELKGRIRHHDLRNVILPGSVPRSQVAEWLRASDVCLVLFRDLPILGTNSPNKLFDALAAGKPVIVNSSGWTKELVERHAVGRVAVPGSASSLAEEILWLRDHPQERDSYGKEARRLAESEFDRQKLAAKLEAVLLVATGSAPPLPYGEGRVVTHGPASRRETGGSGISSLAIDGGQGVPSAGTPSARTRS